MFIFLYINITIKLDLPKNVKEKTDRKKYLKIGIKRIRTSVKSINSTSLRPLSHKTLFINTKGTRLERAASYSQSKLLNQLEYSLFIFT